MTETNKQTNDSLKQNILFRDLIIRRERLKALHAKILGYKRKDNQFNKQETQEDIPLEIKKAHLAHMTQHVQQELAAWNKQKVNDVIFVRTENKNGFSYNAFDKDAIRIAKILGINARKMNINNRMVHYISIPERKMQQVISEISRRDLKTQLINPQGQQVALSPIKEVAPTVSVNIQPKTPQLDVMESLEKNRQDSRQTAIHVESLAVRVDNKGNWTVSGMVNGQTVTAKSIEQNDAFRYKSGEMTKEQLALKYKLQEPPKQQTSISKKNIYTRRYTLDNS